MTSASAANDTCLIVQTWLAEALGDCLISDRDLVGFYVGLFSTACWMCAQLPQVFKNYRLQSAEGLSLLFLVIWFLGDFSNLGGCLLGNLLSDTPVCLSTQTIQAIYFLMIDAILCSQWIWYTKLRPKPKKEDQDPLIADDNAGSIEMNPLEAPNPRTDVSLTDETLPADAKPVASLLMVVPLLTLSMVTVASYSATSMSPTQRQLLEETSTENSTAVVFSQVVAWVSTVMYLACRIPQIVRNRGTTEGLAITMFATAMIANATYTSSIFIRLESLSAVWPRLPWILGSAGVLFFDSVICIQHCYYRSKMTTPPAPNGS